MSRLILSCFLQTRRSPQLPILDMMLLECKQLEFLSGRSERSLCKWYKKLRFCYNDAIKKSKCINNLMLILCFQPAAFFKNETPAQVFSCKFCESFQLATSLKAILWHKCFPVNFAKFLKTFILQNISKGLLLSM